MSKDSASGSKLERKLDVEEVGFALFNTLE
jgi:hypothetical protein